MLLYQCTMLLWIFRKLYLTCYNFLHHWKLLLCLCLWSQVNQCTIFIYILQYLIQARFPIKCDDLCLLSLIVFIISKQRKHKMDILASAVCLTYTSVECKCYTLKFCAWRLLWCSVFCGVTFKRIFYIYIWLQSFKVL